MRRRKEDINIGLVTLERVVKICKYLRTEGYSDRAQGHPYDALERWVRVGRRSYPEE